MKWSTIDRSEPLWIAKYIVGILIFIATFRYGNDVLGWFL